MNFDHDYAEFDEFGPVKIVCMSCGTSIAVRSYVDVPSRLDARKTIPVATLQRLSNLREVSVNLSDGTYTNLKFCKGCFENDFDDYKEKIMGQIRRAWQKEMDFAGAGAYDRAAHEAKTKDMKIIGRA